MFLVSPYLLLHVFCHSTRPCASTGGRETVNSSACLPRHRRSPHPPLHRPPRCAAWKKVCESQS